LRNVDRRIFDVHPILLLRPWEKKNVFIEKLKTENYPLYKVPVAIKPRTEGRDYFRVIRCYRMIHSILKKGFFDLIHTHGYFADIIGIPAAKRLGIPSVSTCHGFISNDLNLNVYNKLDRFALRFANKIIAVSDDVKLNLIRGGIRESEISVIQNAVNGNDCDEIHAQDRQTERRPLRVAKREFVIGYVGRLSEEKGIKYLIEASSLLKEADVPIKTVIVGEGPSRRDLEALVRERKLEEKVFFAGFQAEVESWLRSFDVFILPSLTEGTPMALLEAMACGIPAVASAVGGVPQVIDSRKNGILVSPGKPEEIKNAVHLLYKDEALRTDISAAAQDTIKAEYNVNDWISRLETVYLNMIKRG
jgi:glycosyltransferase involved in cell wall biosynthesis